MSWQDVSEGYDAPGGEKLRIIYRFDVPAWLEWTPDYVMDKIVGAISTIWGEIQRAVADFDVQKYDIKVVDPGNIYHVIIYGTSRGLLGWVAAGIILSLILGIAYFVSVSIVGVQRLVEKAPEFAWGLLAVLLLFGAAAVGTKIRKKPEKEEVVENIV